MAQHYISIIEDDNDDFVFICEACKCIAPGLLLRRFTNAGELFEHIDSDGTGILPALLIIDYNLPLVNGVQILQRLNRNGLYLSVPKVFYSNSNFGLHKTEAISNGAEAYFTKGVDMDDIRQDILKMLVYSNPAVL